jgi:hypothetical protein
MFEMKFETGNAAFADDDGPGEVARLLRKAADQVENGYTRARLIDVNGNTVGLWDWEVAAADDADGEAEAEDEDEAEAYEGDGDNATDDDNG